MNLDPESSVVISTPVRNRLASLLHQPGIVIQESSLGGSDEQLYPEELALVSNCHEKRRREIVASRRCARNALAALGITGFPLLRGPDRAPIWPPTVVGAITHTDGCPNGYCGVAVAKKDLTLGIGVDAEPAQPLARELWPQILDEHEQYDAQAASVPGIYAHLVFSAKETTYKLLYPFSGRFLDFSDIHIQVHDQQGIFFADLVGAIHDLRLPDQRLIGRYLVDDELIVTAMALPTKRL
jgi:4'-phosphopantetheinyl transferase EntD